MQFLDGEGKSVMPSQPLAEVFGFPVTNHSREAARSRQHRLCPFGNRVPNCTKDKANDPLGVCSIFDGREVVITCPIRFRQQWIIAEDAAAFFFPATAKWTTLTEVKLNDKNGKSAGNIDVVLVSYDDRGKVTNFGALEVQAVYISGNVRNPFEYYMQAPTNRASMDWSKRPNYPNPDYLSSSRKRLAPQLIFKGGILRAWNKKIAVALHKRFFETLPQWPEVSREQADIAWLIYDLKPPVKPDNHYELFRERTVYTKRPEGSETELRMGEPMEQFVHQLEAELDEVAV